MERSVLLGEPCANLPMKTCAALTLVLAAKNTSNTAPKRLPTRRSERLRASATLALWLGSC